MRVLTTFNFSNYPELLEKYRKYMTMYNKLTKAINSSAKIDTDELNREIDYYVRNDFALCVYLTFDAKKPMLTKRRGNDKGAIVKWDEVFSVPFEQLDNLGKDNLWGLIDAAFNYVLPSEYYDERLKFQNI
jgi:hypothetical protein